MMTIVPAILAVAALVAWIAAVVHAVRLVRHRKPGITVATLLVRGHMFYSRDNFSEAGAADHRGFVRAALGFAVCLAALVVSALALAPR